MRERHASMSLTSKTDNTGSNNQKQFNENKKFSKRSINSIIDTASMKSMITLGYSMNYSTRLKGGSNRLLKNLKAQQPKALEINLFDTKEELSYRPITLAGKRLKRNNIAMNQLYKNVSVPEFKLSSDDAEAIIVEGSRNDNARRVKSRNERRTRGFQSQLQRNKSCANCMKLRSNGSNSNLGLFSSDHGCERNDDNIFEEVKDREGLSNTQKFFFNRRQQFRKMSRKNFIKAKGNSRLNDLSPYFASARHDLLKRSRKSTDEKFSHLFNRYGVNKIFVPPTFTPNISLEKSINGINASGMISRDQNSMLHKMSQGKISICDISGPIVLYLPGNNTKLFLQGPADNESTKEQDKSPQMQNISAFNTDINENSQFDTSKLEKETTQVKSDTECDLARVGTDPNINKQQSSEKFDQILQNTRIKEHKDVEIKRKKIKTSGSSKRNKKSDKFLMNKINIALSECNNSKNIECRIESGSMHEITISSKTNEKRANKNKSNRIGNNEINFVNASSRARSKRSQKTGMFFKGKILNKIRDTDDIGSIRAPRKKIIIRNFKGKRIKKIGKLKMFNNKSDSYSNLYSPESPIKNLKNETNMDIQNYYDHYIEK